MSTVHSIVSRCYCISRTRGTSGSQHTVCTLLLLLLLLANKQDSYQKKLNLCGI